MQWLKDKFGRIVTLIGSLSLSFDMIPADISPIAQYLQGLVHPKVLSAIGVVCFMLSFARHQQIATRVNKLEQQQK